MLTTEFLQQADDRFKDEIPLHWSQTEIGVET